MCKYGFAFKQAINDSKKVESGVLKANVSKLLVVLKDKPSKTSPPYEKLLGGQLSP